MKSCQRLGDVRGARDSVETHTPTHTHNIHVQTQQLGVAQPITTHQPHKRLLGDLCAMCEGACDVVVAALKNRPVEPRRRRAALGHTSTLHVGPLGTSGLWCVQPVGADRWKEFCCRKQLQARVVGLFLAALSPVASR